MFGWGFLVESELCEMFLESKERTLAALPPANAVASAPAAGIPCPPGRWVAGARESRQLYVSGGRCQQLEAETRPNSCWKQGDRLLDTSLMSTWASCLGSERDPRHSVRCRAPR